MRTTPTWPEQPILKVTPLLTIAELPPGRYAEIIRQTRQEVLEQIECTSDTGSWPD